MNYGRLALSHCKKTWNQRCFDWAFKEHLDKIVTWRQRRTTRYCIQHYYETSWNGWALQEIWPTRCILHHQDKIGSQWRNSTRYIQRTSVFVGWQSENFYSRNSWIYSLLLCLSTTLTHSKSRMVWSISKRIVQRCSKEEIDGVLCNDVLKKKLMEYLINVPDIKKGGHFSTKWWWQWSLPILKKSIL